MFAFYHSKTLFRLSIKEYNIYQISSWKPAFLSTLFLQK